MIYNLQQAELKYLDDKLKQIVSHINRADVNEGLARTVAKMKYKFSPNALKVSLNQKERALLMEMLSYRQQHLISTQSISTEVDIVQALIERFEDSK